MYESARYIFAQSCGYPVILIGDLNVRPDQREYHVIKTLGRFVDSYAMLHPEGPGFTITPENPYKEKEQTKRIDYVLVRNGGSIALSPAKAEVTMKSLAASNGKQNPIAYSDHFGVLVELEASRGVMPSAEAIPSEPDSVKQVLLELVDLLRAALAEAKSRQIGHAAQTVASVAAASGLSILGQQIRTRRQFIKWVVGGAGSFLATSYAVLQGWLALLILPDEIQSLATLLSEVDVQIKARRAFDGTTW
jgi:hypothetical protein